jgi:hypothetical protein
MKSLSLSARALKFPLMQLLSMPKSSRKKLAEYLMVAVLGVGLVGFGVWCPLLEYNFQETEQRQSENNQQKHRITLPLFHFANTRRNEKLFLLESNAPTSAETAMNARIKVDVNSGTSQLIDS